MSTPEQEDSATISRKTIQKWMKIRNRHPELGEIEGPLKGLATEFDRRHRAGVTKERICITEDREEAPKEEPEAR